MLLTRALRTGAFVALAAIGLTACLRFLDTPDPWPCQADADCEDGRACFRGKCLSPDYCDSNADCPGMTACVANQCVPAECTQETEAVCAPYLCKSNVCSTSCSHSSDCDSQHACESEKCIPR